MGVLLRSILNPAHAPFGTVNLNLINSPVFFLFRENKIFIPTFSPFALSYQANLPFLIIYLDFCHVPFYFLRAKKTEPLLCANIVKDLLQPQNPPEPYKEKTKHQQ